MEQKGVCPRCKANSADVGSTIFKIGTTRGIKLITYACPKCSLVFFEKASGD